MRTQIIKTACLVIGHLAREDKIMHYPWGLDADILRAAQCKTPSKVLIKLALLLSIWVVLGLTIIATDSYILKIILWGVLGYFITGVIQIVHECWHNNVFNSPRLNRLTGQILSLLFFTLYEPPRHGHLLHHRFNRTDRDPDAYNAGIKSWDLSLLYYGVFFLGVPLGIIHFNILYPLQFYQRKQLPKHFLQLALLVSCYIIVWTLLIKANLLQQAVQIWLIPLLFASPWNGLKSVADHFNNAWEGNPFQTATTVRSNALTTYFWNGLNYHLEHHLFPTIPGYHLAKLHPHLSKTFKENNSIIFKSYSEVWLKAMKRGPEIVQRQQKFNPFNFQVEQ